MNDTLRLSMWSGPRNVSTALMYSFRQRADTRVVDEPLYAHYLHASGAAHPGRDEVLASLPRDAGRVLAATILAPVDAPVLFIKNMAHHLLGVERSLLGRVTNALLTREPREMLPSLAQQIPSPTVGDTGLQQQVEILDFELARGRGPVVLDARELLTDPVTVLTQACSRFGIGFDPAMLSWPAGPKPEDGVWAKHWYDSVHRSTGFTAYRARTESFPERLRDLLVACLPLYERLAAHAIRAP
jgi:hypothetical protein